MSEYTFSVDEASAGKRIDLFTCEFALAQNLGLSRTSLQKLIEQGKLTVAGQEKLSAHYKIKSGDEITLLLEEKPPTSLLPEKIALDVVYEDDCLAVINKPTGLVVHPAPGNYTHTLVNALLYRFKKVSDVNPLRPGIVHRLDKETSGLLVIAKNNSSHLALAAQFAQHSIKRFYVALVQGSVEYDQGVIEVPIGRNPHKRESMSVSYGANTRYAKTLYRTVKRTESASMLELEPFTGRTHQLRVHLAFIGHPILGDAKYGQQGSFKRMALHARYLGFIHPSTGLFIDFSSEIPQEFSAFFDRNP